MLLKTWPLSEKDSPEVRTKGGQVLQVFRASLQRNRRKCGIRIKLFLNFLPSESIISRFASPIDSIDCLRLWHVIPTSSLEQIPAPKNLPRRQDCGWFSRVEGNKKKKKTFRGQQKHKMHSLLVWYKLLNLG